MDEYELKFIEYNRSNNSRAKNLRNKQTAAEKKMRIEFLKKRPGGYKFTRQKPINSFILDFYCSELLLGIELDGGIHGNRKEYDKQRDEKISKFGITVIRILNEEVIKESNKLYKRLLILFKSMKSPPVKGDIGGLLPRAR